MILTALYPEDGAVYARFCNYSDAPQTFRFSPSAGTLTAETDLLGGDLRPVENGMLEFRPWEIKTLRLTL